MFHFVVVVVVIIIVHLRVEDISRRLRTDDLGISLNPLERLLLIELRIHVMYHVLLVYSSIIPTIYNVPGIVGIILDVTSYMYTYFGTCTCIYCTIVGIVLLIHYYWSSGLHVGSQLL